MSSHGAVIVDMMTADGERPNARMRRCERAEVMTWKGCPLRVESGVASCGMNACDLWFDPPRWRSKSCLGVVAIVASEVVALTFDDP